MSRLSGFIGTYEGEELFAVTWKNYLEIDSFIWDHALSNHLAKDQSSSDDNTTLVFNDFDAFFDTCMALINKVDEGFTEDMIMQHSVKRAKQEWKAIKIKILDFITTHHENYYKKISFEFFSCV